MKDQPCVICGTKITEHWDASDGNEIKREYPGILLVSVGHEWTNSAIDDPTFSAVDVQPIVELTTNDFDPDNILDPAVTPEAYIYKAKLLAAISCYRRGIAEQIDEMPSPDEFYITWFSKTLQNWKALVSTDMAPGLYWEVTYDGDKLQTYVDFYNKEDNFAMTDEELADILVSGDI